MTVTPPTVVALGELLWDIFPDAARFGGAPGNFAHHAASLGGEVWMVSGVGSDKLGLSALEKLRKSGLHSEHVSVSETLPTGSVRVELDDSGHASYHFNDCDAWDHLTWTDDLHELASRSDAVCFGTLGQRNEVARSTIHRFVGSTPGSAWRVLDLNLRPPFYSDSVVDESLQLANVLKLNDEELRYLVDRFALRGQTEREQVVQIAELFQLRLVALTRGDRGGLLVRQGEVSDVKTAPISVVDTVGAGDAFSAAVVMGLISRTDLATINQIACEIAEYVCTQSGATPELPGRLRRAFAAS
jgi:fructokinase